MSKEVIHLSFYQKKRRIELKRSTLNHVDIAVETADCVLEDCLFFLSNKTIRGCIKGGFKEEKETLTYKLGELQDKIDEIKEYLS